MYLNFSLVCGRQLSQFAPSLQNNLCFDSSTQQPLSIRAFMRSLRLSDPTSKPPQLHQPITTSGAFKQCSCAHIYHNPLFATFATLIFPVVGRKRLGNCQDGFYSVRQFSRRLRSKTSHLSGQLTDGSFAFRTFVAIQHCQSATCVSLFLHVPLTLMTDIRNSSLQRTSSHPEFIMDLGIAFWLASISATAAT